jgi:F0F1-type ATP synthase, gamma subunit
MAAQLRLVRRRISSVQSISKITRAQELIASSRIVRAQQQQRSAEPYARELTRAVEAVISRSPTSPTRSPRSREPVPGRRPDPDQRPGLRRRLQRQRPARVGPAAADAARPGHPAGPVRGRPQGHRLAPVPRARAGRTPGAASPPRRSTGTRRRYPKPCSRPSTPGPTTAGWTRSTWSAPTSSPC